MAHTSYFVRLFARRGDALAASALIEAHDTVAAIGEAMRRAQEDAAGAIAFVRLDAAGEASGLGIIIRIGDVPDGLEAVLDPISG